MNTPVYDYIEMLEPFHTAETAREFESWYKRWKLYMLGFSSTLTFVAFGLVIYGLPLRSLMMVLGAGVLLIFSLISLGVSVVFFFLQKKWERERRLASAQLLV